MKGVNPNINKLYKEAITKATAKEKCKVIGKVNILASGQQARQKNRQEDRQKNRQKDGQKNGQENELKDKQDSKDNKNNIVKYTIFDS